MSENTREEKAALNEKLTTEALLDIEGEIQHNKDGLTTSAEMFHNISDICRRTIASLPKWEEYADPAHVAWVKEQDDRLEKMNRGGVQ